MKQRHTCPKCNNTHLWLFQCRSMLHPLCRGVVIDLMGLWGVEELLCFNHVLYAGMKELEWCPVHTPESLVPEMKHVILWQYTTLSPERTKTKGALYNPLTAASTCPGILPAHWTGTVDYGISLEGAWWPAGERTVCGHSAVKQHKHDSQVDATAVAAGDKTSFPAGVRAASSWNR